jgi:hypothetical protein
MRKTRKMIQIIARIFSFLIIIAVILFVVFIICNTLVDIQTEFIEQSSLQLSTVFGDIQMSGVMVVIFVSFIMANSVLTAFQIFQIVRTKVRDSK